MVHASKVTEFQKDKKDKKDDLNIDKSRNRSIVSLITNG